MATDVLACGTCGKSYRVPDASKTYSCKACGGRVGAAVDDATPRPAPTRAAAAAAARSPESNDATGRCPACAKDAAPGARFCEHCGAGLDGKTPAEAADPTTRALAVRALAKAKRSVDLARNFYLGGAVLHGLWLLGVVIFDVKTGQSIAADWLSLLPPLVLLVLHVLAVRRIVDQPVAWSVSLAALKTLDAAWAVLIGLAAQSLVLPVVPVLWCAALWWIALEMSRAQRTIRRFPTLWNLRSGKAAAAGRTRHAEAAARQMRKNLVTLGVVAVVAVLGVVGWRIATAPPAFEPALDRLVDAWNGQRRADVVAFFPTDKQAKLRTWLDRKSASRDWSAALPILAAPAVDGDGPARRATFVVPGGELTMTFELVGDAWQGDAVTFR
ncbi:MAG: hypothetical protein JNL94_13325 [Planctomycetes bacterium]|nr:hypothetical protein [Planctomycetota bacterium]